RCCDYARQFDGDQLWLTVRIEMTRVHLVAKHGRPLREVPPAHGERDSGAARGAEMGVYVGLAVAVRVTQGEDAARAHTTAHERNENVPVRRDGQVACPAHLVRHDYRAKAGGQREAAVVGITGW